MSIRILNEEVINQIAAGEVVERPAHLVKELIENSLDAKARHIHLFVSDGGRQINLQDDGIGMNEKDLSLCIERHSTSKIQKEEDLWKLSSFGFRGEALASIAAVTKLSITSRLEGSEVALRLNCQFGQKQGPPQRCAGTIGTNLYLKDLFENTPARLKFLKSPHAEAGQIKRVIKAIALSHPQVEFKMKREKEVSLFYPQCESHLQRAKQVLEIENLYEGRIEKKDFEAHAIFAAPNESVKSRRQMWLFVQDRWIQDAGLQSSIVSAYTGFMMKGMYPQVVLFLTCPKKEVDVNVHPNKSTIRFTDNQLAFRVVYVCFRQALEKTPWLSQILGPQTNTSSKETFSSSISNEEPSYTYTSNANSKSLQKRHLSLSSSYASGGLQLMGSEKTHFQVKEAPLPYEKSGEKKDEQSKQNEQNITNISLPFEREISKENFVFNKKVEDSPLSQPQKDKIAWGKLQILGQANLTYIITQSNNSIIFIDQHAAHERVLFESLMLAHQGEKMSSQQLLLPQALPFPRAYIEVLQKQQKNLEKLCIHLENTGPYQMSIVALPSLIKRSGIAEELKEFSEEILSMGGSSRIHKVIHNLCASIACHSSIRAGQAIDTKEIQGLLDKMDCFPLSSFCPHGRPVFVKYPFRKLEREFGRLS